MVRVQHSPPQRKPNDWDSSGQSIPYAVDQPTLNHLRFFLLVRLREAFGLTPFFTCSFGRSGFGLKPNRPSFHACLRSRGVRGVKCSGFGGSWRYMRLISGALTVPRSVRPAPVNGSNPPRLSVVLYEVRAGEGRLLRHDNDISC